MKSGDPRLRGSTGEDEENQGDEKGKVVCLASWQG